jgi:ketosteroid isomerase-like protein
MSEGNVKIVRAIYQAFNDEAWDTAYRFMAPEFEATFQRGLMAGTHRGRDSVRAILQDQRAAFDRWVIEVERLVENGDQVVAVVQMSVRPQGTDAEIQNRNGWIWTIRDGLAVSMRGFPDPEDALEAAGLRE